MLLPCYFENVYHCRQKCNTVKSFFKAALKRAVSHSHSNSYRISNKKTENIARHISIIIIILFR